MRLSLCAFCCRLNSLCCMCQAGPANHRTALGLSAAERNAAGLAKCLLPVRRDLLGDTTLGGHFPDAWLHPPAIGDRLIIIGVCCRLGQVDLEGLQLPWTGSRQSSRLVLCRPGMSCLAASRSYLPAQDVIEGQQERIWARAAYGFAATGPHSIRWPITHVTAS